MVKKIWKAVFRNDKKDEIFACSTCGYEDVKTGKVKIDRNGGKPHLEADLPLMYRGWCNHCQTERLFAKK